MERAKFYQEMKVFPNELLPRDIVLLPGKPRTDGTCLPDELLIVIGVDADPYSPVRATQWSVDFHDGTRNHFDPGTDIQILRPV